MNKNTKNYTIVAKHPIIEDESKIQISFTVEKDDYESFDSLKLTAQKDGEEVNLFEVKINDGNPYIGKEK